MTEEEHNDEHRQSEAHDPGGPDHDAEAAAAGKGAEQGKGNAAAGEGADAQAGTSPSVVIPDVAHYLVGWRVWAVNVPDMGTISPPYLASFGVGPFVWPHRQALQATCTMGGEHAARTEEPPPSAECSCGIYAFRTEELLEREISRRVNDSVIRGSVALWGKVVECEDGYRAQYAYPLKLLVPPFRPDTAEQRNRLIMAWALGKAYGIEVAMLPMLVSQTWEIHQPQPPAQPPRRIGYYSSTTNTTNQQSGNGGMGVGVGAPKAVWDAYSRGS